MLSIPLCYLFVIISFFFLSQVAEFANVRKQLEVLEDRLEEMVQPRLSDALSGRKVPSLFSIMFGWLDYMFYYI